MISINGLKFTKNVIFTEIKSSDVPNLSLIDLLESFIKFYRRNEIIVLRFNKINSDIT